LKTRQANGIKGQMMGAASVADGERVHAEVVERDDPGGKGRGDHFISLQVDAANLTGAIIDVVVGVELGVLWSRLHDFGIGEMLLDVGPGAEQALLLAGP